MFVHVAADILFQIWSYTLLKAEKKEKKGGTNIYGYALTNKVGVKTILQAEKETKKQKESRETKHIAYSNFL